MNQTKIERTGVYIIITFYFTVIFSTSRGREMGLRSLGFVLVVLLLLASVGTATEEAGKIDAAETTETEAVVPRPSIPPLKRFVVDEIASNHTLVRKELVGRGWVEPSRAAKKRSSWSGSGAATAHFLWTWSVDRTKAAPAGQIVNHFPHFQEIGTKIGLWKNLYALHQAEASLLLRQEAGADLHPPPAGGEGRAAPVVTDVHTFFPRCYLLVGDPEAERTSDVVVDPLVAEREKRRFMADFLRGEPAPKLVACDGEECTSSSARTDGAGQQLSELRPWPQQPSIEGSKNIWIVKPSRAARGVGIQLFSNLTALLEHTLGVEAAAELMAAPKDFAPGPLSSSVATAADQPAAAIYTNTSIPIGHSSSTLNPDLTTYTTTSAANDDDTAAASAGDPSTVADEAPSSEPSFIVQKYIERPLLVSGLKFDMRQFVLVASLDPLVVFISDDFYLRFTAQPFTLDNIDDRFLHLTNHQVQKHAPDFHSAEIKENQWSSRTFIQHLSDTYGEGTWEKRITPLIDKLIVTTMLSWPSSGHREGSFEMLGLDIMLDEDLRPWLLEVNTNPGLHLLTGVVNEHHPKFVADMFKVIIDERASWEALPAFNPTFTAGEEAPMVVGSLRLAYKGHKSTTASQPPATASPRKQRQRGKVRDWDNL